MTLSHLNTLSFIGIEGGEIILLVIQLAFLALGLYIAILVIKALKKYLREG